MSDDIYLYRAIAAREKASRRAAEILLEQKIRDLYLKNRELELATTELESANTILTKVLSVSPDGVLLCSTDLRIQDANAAAMRQLGRSTDELLGATLSRFFPTLEAHLSLQVNGNFRIDQIDALNANGATFPIELRGFAGRISDEIHYLLLFNDITRRLQNEERRKQMDQQLDEARRLEAIGALSAGIAHEINTPIQFVGDNLEYLKAALEQIHSVYLCYEKLRLAAIEFQALDAAVQAIDAINASVNLDYLIPEVFAALSESREGICQVRDIVLLMKEFTHPGTGAKEDTDLNQIARNVSMLCRNQTKGVAEIELSLDPELPPTPCRRGQLQQVILNLLVNSLDAIREARPKDGVVRISTTFDEEFVIIAISDNGPGVPASIRAKIFDPFFTTKPVGKGTGQGLALAKDCVVKGHGGLLELVNVEGFATTFQIKLPRRLENRTSHKEQDHELAA